MACMNAKTVVWPPTGRQTGEVAVDALCGVGCGVLEGS
jgi:hypothetical protein